MNTLPIFHHTSTLILLDDDTLFLKALSEILKPTFQIKCFNHPQDCIDFFNHYTSPLSTIPFLRSCKELDNHETIQHSFVDFNVPALHALQNNPARQEEISV